MENIIYLFSIVCAIWVIYDVWLVNKKISSGARIIWTVFALLFNIITAVVYYFTQKK